MAKPVGAACNLACGYCYYQDKSRLYGAGGTRRMSDDMLELFVRSYIEASPQQDVLFTWHGGEPLLRGLDFYQRALRLQRKYAAGHKIDNCIQTNGTMIDRQWCEFFRENNILVGLSIDGPRHVHDYYRTDSSGRPSWAVVTGAARMLSLYNVEWNAMAVVSDLTIQQPLEFYRFFRDELRCRFLQFAPLVERFEDGRMLSPEEPGGRMAPFAVTPQGWGDFLCAIYDEWVTRDVGEMFVQLFDATLANWAGVPPGLCTLAPDCGHALVMEHNGDVYSCDHFVYSENKLGNLRDTPFPAMLLSDKQSAFAQRSRELPGECRLCEWLRLCNGECPKNRVTVSADGGRLNYLCAGYRRFFSHSAPTMRVMLDLWQRGLPASLVME